MLPASTCVSGQAILRAILRGERDPQQLAALCQPGIKATREVVAKSLEGNWRTEHLIVLQQEFETYQHFQRLVESCDAALYLYQHLQAMEEKADPQQLPCPRHKRPRGNAVQ